MLTCLSHYAFLIDILFGEPMVLEISGTTPKPLGTASREGGVQISLHRHNALYNLHVLSSQDSFHKTFPDYFHKTFSTFFLQSNQIRITWQIPSHPSRPFSNSTLFPKLFLTTLTQLFSPSALFPLKKMYRIHANSFLWGIGINSYKISSTILITLYFICFILYIPHILYKILYIILKNLNKWLQQLISPFRKWGNRSLGCVILI